MNGRFSIVVVAALLAVSGVFAPGGVFGQEPKGKSSKNSAESKKTEGNAGGTTNLGKGLEYTPEAWKKFDQVVKQNSGAYTKRYSDVWKQEVLKAAPGGFSDESLVVIEIVRNGKYREALRDCLRIRDDSLEKDLVKKLGKAGCDVRVHFIFSAAPHSFLIKRENFAAYAAMCVVSDSNAPDEEYIPTSGEEETVYRNISRYLLEVRTRRNQTPSDFLKVANKELTDIKVPYRFFISDGRLRIDWKGEQHIKEPATIPSGN